MILKNKNYPKYHVASYGLYEIRIFRDGKSKPLKPDPTCTETITYILSLNGRPRRVSLWDFLLDAKPVDTI